MTTVKTVLGGLQGDLPTAWWGGFLRALLCGLRGHRTKGVKGVSSGELAGG